MTPVIGVALQRSKGDTIRRMNLVWIGVAVAAVIGLAVAIRRLVASAEGESADADLGTVSEGWLSDERGRKDS